MAAGYHSNRQHSDGCFLGIVQNIVGCCCCCDGSTDEEEEKKTDIEKKGKGGGEAGEYKYVPGDKEKAREEDE